MNDWITLYVEAIVYDFVIELWRNPKLQNEKEDIVVFSTPQNLSPPNHLVNLKEVTLRWSGHHKVPLERIFIVWYRNTYLLGCFSNGFAWFSWSLFSRKSNTVNVKLLNVSSLVTIFQSSNETCDKAALKFNETSYFA